MSSSSQIEKSGDTKQFTVTAFLAFVVVFSIVMLFSQCHGDFKPVAQGTDAVSAVEK